MLRTVERCRNRSRVPEASTASSENTWPQSLKALLLVKAMLWPF
jgi:hypothetical protein